MKARRFLIGSCFLLLLLLPLYSAQALDSQAEKCAQDVYDLMGSRQRFYRIVLFGQEAAATLPINSTRYDRSGNVWLKTGKDAWQSLSSTAIVNNENMDKTTEFPVRTGIFSIRKTVSSDLLPPILQSFRAFSCELRTICQLARDSRDAKGSLTVEVVGCKPVTFNPLPGCTELRLTDVSADSCRHAADTILDREAKVLETVVTYDTAYRSLAQFAGVIEGIFDDFRMPLLEPLWHAAQALGAFDQIPCFASQCDE